MDIFNRMNVDGVMSGESSSRLGVTQEPLISENVMTLSPLHSLLRTFDFIFKLLCLLRAGIFTWSENRNQLGHSYVFYQRSKDEIKTAIKDTLHLSIEVPDSTGKGGTTTNGNAINTLLSNAQNRKLMASFVPVQYQVAMEEVLLRL